MEPIKGVELDELFKQAADEIVGEQKTSAVQCIKKLAFKIYGLEKEIKRLDNQKGIKYKQLTKALDISERIKNGDWLAINDKNINVDVEEPGEK